MSLKKCLQRAAALQHTCLSDLHLADENNLINLRALALVGSFTLGCANVFLAKACHIPLLNKCYVERLLDLPSPLAYRRAN
jgi:hypothetical protein